MSRPLSPTPPMGWNSWNTFSWNVNEELILSTAEYMVSEGLLDAGYEYVVIDDCWSEKQRENGRLVPDRKKFPNGIRPIADRLHSLGLKLGIYSCAGTHTCGGFPGSFEHEFTDADTFAEWGVDYLKYDYCYKPDSADGENLYRRMGMALRCCGRDIVLSACCWGKDEVHKWIRHTGAQLFRSTGDIRDNWDSIKTIALSQLDKTYFSAPYCHNDLDMLVVGMHGKSDNSWIADVVGGCSDTEYKTHFALWALMSSPLMVGCDIRNMKPSTKNILLNKDIISIDQDIECRGPYVIRQWNNPQKVFALVKPLYDGSYAIGMFNFGDRTNEMSLQLYDMGLPVSSGRGLSLYDCYSHKDTGVFSERIVQNIPSRDCMVFKARAVRL